MYVFDNIKIVYCLCRHICYTSFQSYYTHRFFVKLFHSYCIACMRAYVLFTLFVFVCARHFQQ
jgi:hypothetical protein